MWLACHSQDEIAAAVELTHQAVAKIQTDFATFGNLAESCKAAANHATDFEPPIYNVWKQQEKTAGSKHFGNSDSRWVGWHVKAGGIGFDGLPVGGVECPRESVEFTLGGNHHEYSHTV